MKKHLSKSIIIALLVVMLVILTAPVALASGGSYHTVRWGETLYSIGRLYGVNPHHIANVNNLYNPDYIYAGQVLYIPTGYYDDGYYDGGYDDGYYNPCRNRHVVSYGETLTGIGYRYGVSPWAIASANHIYNMNCIYAGQTLYIPAGGGCY